MRDFLRRYAGFIRTAEFALVLRGHMHISPFSLAPASEGARRARRRSVIDCLEAIMREGNLNSRTTPQGSPPEAVRSAHP